MKDGDRQREVGGQKHVQQPRGQWNDHHGNNQHDKNGEHDVGHTERAAMAGGRDGGGFDHVARLSEESWPTEGRALLDTRSTMVRTASLRSDIVLMIANVRLGCQARLPPDLSPWRDRGDRPSRSQEVVRREIF